MKKLILSTLTATTCTTAVFAGQLTRETPSGCGAGTSEASICNSSVCTAFTSLGYGASTPFIPGALMSITVTFDYAFYPGSVTTFSLNSLQIATIDAAGGAYVNFTIGGDHLRIRQIGRDAYSYYVFTSYC